MPVCPKCKHKQTEGKNCESCGFELEQLEKDQTFEVSTDCILKSTALAPPEQEMPSVDKQFEVEHAATLEPQSESSRYEIKDILHNYWGYFLGLLKNTMKAMQLTERDYINSLITIAVYSVLSAFSLYLLPKAFYGIWIPFYSTFISLLIFVLILFIISFGSMFLMLKVGKNEDSFKLLLTQYGSLIAPFTTLNVISIFGGLVGGILLWSIPIVVSVTCTFLLIPVLIVFEKLDVALENGLRLHLSIGTVLVSGFMYFLLSEYLLINLLENILMYF